MALYCSFQRLLVRAGTTAHLFPAVSRFPAVILHSHHPSAAVHATSINNTLSSCSRRDFSIITFNTGKQQPDTSAMPDDAKTTKRRIPLLKETLRKLILKIHPDRFSTFPHAQESNGRNLTLLNEFIASISKTASQKEADERAAARGEEDSPYPPAGVKVFEFYLLEDQPPASVQGIPLRAVKTTGMQIFNEHKRPNPTNLPMPVHHLKKVNLTIRLNGGNCQKVIERSLSEFFAKSGLEPRFQWGPGFFELQHISTPGVSRKVRERNQRQQEAEYDE